MGEDIKELCSKAITMYSSRCYKGNYDSGALDSALELLEPHKELEQVIAARLGLISFDIMVRRWHQVPGQIRIDELEKLADEERKKLEGKEKPEYADNFAVYGLTKIVGKTSDKDIHRLKEEYLARFK